MNLLVTGATGFVGRHFLAQFPGIPLAAPDGGFVDLGDTKALSLALEAAKPDAVLHLAAQSFVPESFANPMDTFKTNVMGTLNLLTTLNKTGFKGRMVQVGSAQVYGQVEEAALPVAETQPLRPRSPYAASKAAAEMLAYQWSCTGGFEVVLTRPFNHTGPGQDDRFVLAQFARQVAEIKLGLREPVVVIGDFDATRDFTDVRDVARAYSLLLKKGVSGEVYNICSGQERGVGKMLTKLLDLAGTDAEIRRENVRLRPGEQRRMLGSPEKIRRETGWQPEIPMEQTLSDTLAFWEDKLR